MTATKKFGIEVFGMAAYGEEAPRRKAARRRIQTEKDAGRLKPPRCCQGCEMSALTLEAHHPRHDLVLEVKWLCDGCHTAADRSMS